MNKKTNTMNKKTNTMNKKTNTMNKKLNLITETLLCTVFAVTAFYLMIPAYNIPIQGNQAGFALPQPAGEIAVVLFSISTIGLILLGVFGTVVAMRKGNRQKAIATAVACAAIAWLCLPMVVNTTSWLGQTPVALAFEKIVANATADEKDAGETYLKAIRKSVDPLEFQKTLTPLLSQHSWVFSGENPNLYLVNGETGKTNVNEPAWSYDLPLGTGRENIKAMLNAAQKDVDNEDLTSAAQKVELALGIGNRISDDPRYISTLIGGSFLNEALSFLETNPAIKSFEGVKTELERAGQFPDKVANALKQDFLRTNKLFESLARQDGRITVVSSTINANYWPSIGEKVAKLSKTNSPDWGKFVKSEKIKAMAHAQFLHSVFVNSMLPIVDVDWLQSVQRKLNADAAITVTEEKLPDNYQNNKVVKSWNKQNRISKTE